MLWETFKMSWDNIRAAKMRSLLTMLGVIIGVFAVISLVTIAQGTKVFMSDTISGFGMGPTYLELHAGKKGEMFGFVAEKLTYQDARAIADQAKLVESVDPRIVQSGEFTYRKNSYKAPMIMGVTPALIEMMTWRVDAGKFFTDVDVEMRRRVVVLGPKVARKLFGSFSSIGEKVKLNGFNFLVVGLMEQKGLVFGFDYDQMAIIPVTAASDVFKIEKLAEIGAVAVSEKDVPAAVAEIRSILMKRHGKEDFRIDTMEESMAMMDTIMNALTGIIVGIAAISLLVGGIGIMNIMLVSVTERTREIGIRKAIGAKRADITLQFVVEAAIISLVGGLIGIILGVGLPQLIMLAIGLPPTIPFWAIFLAVTVSITVGIVSGVYPAVRAGRLDPVEALRYE